MSARPTCGAAVTFTLKDRQHYDAIPNAAHMVNPTEPCGLDPDHTGRHSGLVQAQDLDAVTTAQWWVAWSDGEDGYVIEQDDGCPAVTDADEICLLRQGHPGGHDYC